MSDKPCTFSYKSKACKFVHPADSSPQFLHVFKDASFFSRYSPFGVPINFGFCLFRAIENNRHRTIFFFSFVGLGYFETGRRRHQIRRN